MATPNITDEEIQFRKRARRRLVGAIVLVLVVVVVVPWILPADKPQQDTQQIDIRIPAQDASGFASKVTPAPAPEAAPRPEAAPQPAPVAEPPAPAAAPAVPTPPTPESKPEPKAEAAPEPAPAAAAAAEPKPAAAPLAAGETIFIQYGAFSEAKNAKQRQADLKAKGIATYTEVVKTSGGDRIRVRSGPYATHDAAEKVRQKAKPLDSKLVVIGGKE
jgi:DedD protein